MKQIIYSMLPLLNVNLLLILLLLSTQSCKQATEPRLEPELALTLEDVSCTEAWIQLKTTNLQLPATLTLYKNNVAQNNILCYGDTLLYIDSLLPNQTYKFKVVITNNPQPTTYPQPPTSNELTVTTMDTTSHNFTWQSWEFGECSNSVLYDVAIIDENNIWAVGEIYLRDSLGNCDPNAYNAVHWDGTKWELKRIPIYLGSGFPFYPVIKSIFAFRENDIWFEAGIHWDGISFKQVAFNIQWNGNVNKLWGSSSSDLYAVGNNGNIAHWDGVRWRKIESGTTLNINDIWGDFNKKQKHYEIISIASNIYTNDGKEILLLKDQTTKKLSTGGLGAYFDAIWFKSDRHYFVVGGYIYHKRNVKTSENWKIYPSGQLNNNYAVSIRGSDFNNIFIAGAYGEIIHFNGYSWKNYSNEVNLINGEIKEIAVKGNTKVFVGYNGNKAAIIKAK